MMRTNENSAQYMERLAKESPEQWRAKYIYGLIDPDSQQIRYIGKSIRPLQRLQNHMNERSNCHRSHWLQNLKARGLMPELVILEEIRGEWPWQEAERYWIARAKSLGWPLVNNTVGGDGVEGLPPETRRRMAKVWVGRKHRPETLQKLRIARRARTTSEETRKKMSASQTGRKITWTAKIAEQNRKLTIDEVEAIKLRIKSGEKVKDVAKALGLHRTTLSRITTGTYFMSYKDAVQFRKNRLLEQQRCHTEQLFA